jgi:hypothetical protein
VRPSRKRDTWHESASRLLEVYGDRGVFRSHVSKTIGPTSVSYVMRWHRNREFQLKLDRSKRVATIADVLPGLAEDSSLYRDLKEFIAGFQDGTRLEHRSVDRRKARVSVGFKGGVLLLSLRMLDTDFEYAVSRLLSVVLEIYLAFITGPYDEYRVQHLGADPDWGR